jgi:hypothetical protein
VTKKKALEPIVEIVPFIDPKRVEEGYRLLLLYSTQNMLKNKKEGTSVT